MDIKSISKYNQYIFKILKIGEYRFMRIFKYSNVITFNINRKNKIPI